MLPPYRDEKESLRAENERLRAVLEARRRPRAGLVVLLLVADVCALLALRPWLNGSSDAKFWGALAILVLLALAAFMSALGFVGRP